MGETNGEPHTNGVTVPVVNGHGSSYAAKHNLAPHFIGGNHLEVAPASLVKDFVANNDGHTVITSVRLTPALISERSNGVDHVIDICSVGVDRKQWDRCRQGDPIRPEMGLRDFWR